MHKSGGGNILWVGEAGKLCGIASQNGRDRLRTVCTRDMMHGIYTGCVKAASVKEIIRPAQ